MNPIFPKALKKGDRIAIISPAGAVEESQLQKGLEMIKSKGFEPVLGKHLYTKFPNGYNYAGTEKERISDLNWALNNEEISAIWASRGGYGCQHLLRHLKLSKFRKNPKWYIGYSDNTVIQSFLLKNGFASIHGQTIKTSSFGVTDESYDLTFDILKGKLPKYSIAKNDFNKNGKAEGELVGGNLALIYALLGTPYSFNFKDKILFIEDIGEHFYALDRMLKSLDLAGVFRKIKGLVIGGMTNMGDEKDNKNYEESFDELAYKIISERIAKYDFPTVFGFPNGHIYDNRPLIIGGNIKVEIKEKVKIEF
ncbi:S66 peptidase family protein [Chryseobacterium koreense]|uniref:Peptidase U61 n=1 Tax=Chryseobacterium koreense CCUG 49689 TaxID=1304281 RepID=A0A0J7IZZ6_9FLAO|nr:LD-carboxypeptidase [Chryseobacterium koreense]KMQ71401.1 peptidase U61 [Chryseobacterium koreense CCUG 49689]MBB5332240.1 muramoyltetrapeptide carboxypeptidase [Chryseobacterium koreense]